MASRLSASETKLSQSESSVSAQDTRLRKSEGLVAELQRLNKGIENILQNTNSLKGLM